MTRIMMRLIIIDDMATHLTPHQKANLGVLGLSLVNPGDVLVVPLCPWLRNVLDVHVCMIYVYVYIYVPTHIYIAPHTHVHVYYH